eukprot:CAMPEP_0184293092 /NCGR_PEP_ID=MMETSP1049-20130417/4667_1 /TAXON_ID=77928 /ORGANISM="Proteomonas sulcata, Strain CCMP704" /LENGTH=182 /DNA_ID=CAMNT_0026601023 /DNA_START=40 /DNA_END=588 /DNA_ORIENTATION=-
MNYPIASVEIIVWNRLQFGLDHAEILEILRHRGIGQSLKVTDGHRVLGNPVEGREDENLQIFPHAVAARAFTCFGDVRGTLLRPDLLETENYKASASEGSPLAPLECLLTSDISLSPQAINADVGMMRNWDGALLYGSTDRMGPENCENLKGMIHNGVYKGLAPYFPDSYTSFLRHHMDLCG